MTTSSTPPWDFIDVFENESHLLKDDNESYTIDPFKLEEEEMEVNEEILFPHEATPKNSQANNLSTAFDVFENESHLVKNNNEAYNIDSFKLEEEEMEVKEEILFPHEATPKNSQANNLSTAFDQDDIQIAQEPLQSEQPVISSHKQLFQGEPIVPSQEEQDLRYKNQDDTQIAQEPLQSEQPVISSHKQLFQGEPIVPSQEEQDLRYKNQDDTQIAQEPLQSEQPVISSHKQLFQGEPIVPSQEEQDLRYKNQDDIQIAQEPLQSEQPVISSHKQLFQGEPIVPSQEEQDLRYKNQDDIQIAQEPLQGDQPVISRERLQGEEENVIIVEDMNPPSLSGTTKLTLKFNDISIIEEEKLAKPGIKLIKTTTGIPKFDFNGAESEVVFFPFNNTVLKIDIKENSGEEKYNRIARPCVYCKKFVKDMSAHLKGFHKNESRVQRIMRENNPKLRRQMFSALRKEGIDLENKARIGSKKKIIVQRRSSKSIPSEQLSRCSNCFVWMHSRNSSTHVKRCFNAKLNRGKGMTSITNHAIMEEEYFHEAFQESVIKTMKKDEVTNVVVKDKEITYIGNNLFEILLRRRKRPKSIRNRVSAAMRGLSILKTVVSNMPQLRQFPDLMVSDILNVHQFNVLKLALRSLLYKDDNSLKPGASIAYETAITQAVKSLINLYTIARDEDKRKNDLKEFQAYLKENRALLFGEVEEKTCQNQASRMADKLPSDSEIKEVNQLCDSTIKSLEDIFEVTDEASFVTLRQAVVTRLIFFNGRRPTEVASITTKHWELSKNNAYTSEAMMKAANAEEKSLLESYYIIINTGKRNREVPILIPKSLTNALNKLCDAEVRNSAGVNKSNTYAFASCRNSSSFADGCDSVRHFMRSHKLKYAITSEQIRHLLATKIGSMECSDSHHKIIAKFFGHDLNINKTVYQMPQTVKAISVMAPVLTMENNSENEINQEILEDTASTYPSESSSSLMTAKETLVNTPNCKRKREVTIQESPLFDDSTYMQNKDSSSSSEDSEYFSPKKKTKRVRKKWAPSLVEKMNIEFKAFIFENDRYPRKELIEGFIKLNKNSFPERGDCNQMKKDLRVKLNNLQGVLRQKIKKAKKKIKNF